ncbi:hypothetical protein SAMN06265348_104121 [Pedobacter westerhofensis]|uniref:Uncharacterized protein n=1 Tax=Pedobacter westerhofensis TaxID=425512 RepID=A0A521CQR9_9SPHI|nr:hypothetical protein [Pedobacter westerhofensis]SMO61715.1 hypothetical protein SAMN06265348_104121 [Pedobacter westerhofensis]
MEDKERYYPVSSIDLDKVYKVRNKRLSLGYSARELSFLLGYRAHYVRDVEDPTQTLRYSVKDTNYLLLIFKCDLREIMEAKIPEDYYFISVKKLKDAAGITSYLINKQTSGIKHVTYQNFSDEVEKISKSKIDSEIYRYVESLFENGYFDTPRTGLEVFSSCETVIVGKLLPHLVINAIGRFTGKRKSPRLITSRNKSGRTVYLRDAI